MTSRTVESIGFQGVRRVVTGHDQAGKAVVVDDAVIEPTSPDFGQKWSVWTCDAAPSLPDAGKPPAFGGPLLPKPGGLHVMLFTLPARFNPDTLQSPNSAEMAEWIRRHNEAKGDTHPVVRDPNPPGSYGTLPGASGMHATASVDCLMQVSGESVLVLEDAEVRLQAGDWLVVNGVMHSWRNDHDQPAVMVGVVYGAHHDGAPLRRR
jgi:mannose-6-phosphate isomerase-like protein (cupin superfamily)